MLARTHGELVQIAFEGVGGGGVVGDDALMGVEKLAAFCGDGVGLPDAGGLAIR